VVLLSVSQVTPAQYNKSGNHGDYQLSFKEDGNEIKTVSFRHVVPFTAACM
jgi:hypothetical protein